MTRRGAGVVMLGLLAVACGKSHDSDRRVRAKAMLNRAEARAGLQRIMDAALAYHAEHGKLPDPAPFTPPLGTCCTAEALAVSQGLHEEGRKCAVDPARWATPPWSDLRFRVDEPHRASYALEISGSPPNQMLVARAQIDIDCNGSYATFVLRARTQGGELVPETALIVENESE